MDLKQKIATNTWDHIDDVLPILEAARRGDWNWFNNWRHKYIEIRIDMRDGGCILKDRDGNRIEPADLHKQSGPGRGMPWADFQALMRGREPQP